MKKSRNKIISIVLMLMLMMTVISGCSKKKEADDSNVETNNNAGVTSAATDTPDDDKTLEPTKAAVNKPAETKTIRWGTHWVAGLDPYYQDPTTGDYTLGEAERQASIAALEKAKELLNVEVEFIEYASDTRSELITSVLAGNPVCDIANIWGGAESIILAQNILQELDNYADLFLEEEYSWMFYDKLYGHNYLFTGKQAFIPRWPLLYNITMIEKVDSLKDSNGRTIYPMDLYLEGNWTFSTFKDYLQKISTYYANVVAPDACYYDTVQAYETDLRFAGLSAMYAAGGGIYRGGALVVDSTPSLKGTSFITELRNEWLLTDPGFYDDGYTPVWLKGCDDFRDGGTVFTDCADWMIGSASTAASDRGEAIGIVPYPRPDDMSFNDPEYQQVLTVGDSLGILKGVDEETTKLCLEFIKIYYETYYETYGQVDSVLDYKSATSSVQAASFGFDILNEEYGDALLETFISVAENTVSNDYADLLGIRTDWDGIWGKALTGTGGSPSYDVAINANLDIFNETVRKMEEILSTNEIKDNIAPSITKLKTPVFAKGTDPSSISWADYFSAIDAIDGVLDISSAEIDYSSTDFSAVGKYSGGVIFSISDKSGNSVSDKPSVIIYDPDNTEKPVITVTEALPQIVLDTDTSSITWNGNYIASATDRDGFDISESIKADLSELDTTTPGEYDVVITVTDYAGNQNEVTLTVEVVSK